MRTSALIASSALLIALSGSSTALSGSQTVPTDATTHPLLGVLRPLPVRGSTLARLDVKTLKPLAGRRVALGRNTGAWSFSPDRSKLAIGVDRALGLRIVDVRVMRRTADVETKNGDVLAVAWLTPRRIVGLERTGLFVVDPVRHRLVASKPVTGTFAGWARTPSRLLVLLGPPPTGIPVGPVTEGGAALGPTRLLAIDAQAHVRSVRLDSIRSGGAFDSGAPLEAWVPGLAVDTQGQRAFVVGGGGPIAEIDLQTLKVTYHELREPRSFLGRALDWFVPAAAAKGPIAGRQREAAWLGDGTLAIAGVDVSVAVRRDGIDVSNEPFGLKLVDTRTWTARTLEPRATAFAHEAGVLLAYAGSYDEGYRPSGGLGLAGYTIGGAKLFHAFGESAIFWAEIVGSNAYLAPEGKIVRVDVRSGRVMQAIAGPLPQLVR